MDLVVLVQLFHHTQILFLMLNFSIFPKKIYKKRGDFYMKIIYALLLTSPLCLNAMFGVPDVTHWKEICKKDKQRKKELVVAYKNFCKERVNNNIKWATASLVPLIIPNIIRDALQEASGKIPVTVRNAVNQTKEHMLHRIP